jgi:beta-glucosidase
VKHSRRKRALNLVLAVAIVFSLFSGSALASEKKWIEETTKDGWVKVTQEGGPVLGYSPDSGVSIIEMDGFAFKDMDRDGELDVYEDWRLDDETRAQDLASQMTLEQATGLMNLQFDRSGSSGVLGADTQYQIEHGVRAFGNNVSSSVETTVSYVNMIQAYVEALDFGIPIETHAETSVSGISTWPNNLGMAATFDPALELVRANWYAKEYRALGITSPNLPQIDMSTDPRYNRFAETFGEDPRLVVDMSAAFVNGLQSTFDEEGNDLGWGDESANAVVKHFPGDGTNEGGREAHNEGAFGKWNVYPGDQFYTHLLSFEATFNLEGETKSAAAVMPAYSIFYDEDGEYMGDENVGASYNYYIITELLREELGFDGMICTDYGITTDGVNAYGVEGLDVIERHYLLLESGVDQVSMGEGFDALYEAVQRYAANYGEQAALERVQTSAARIIKNSMQIGLFENPYLSAAESATTVGCDEAVDAGYEAQLKSIVMLKNEGDIIGANDASVKPTVYIPLRYNAGAFDFATMSIGKAGFSLPLDASILSKYFNIVTDTVGEPSGEGGDYVASDVIRASAEELAAVDYALVFASSPRSSGYDKAAESYVPVSLQYRPYTANSIYVRQNSISGEEVTIEVQDTYGAQIVNTRENNSYYGKSSVASNQAELDLILYAAEHCDKVIVAVDTTSPFIVSEFEDQVDAILLYFSVSETAVLDIVTGQYEPSGLLPFQMPANMETVEAQYEDVPRDMDCYVDAEGNTYDFAYGLNWSGVIDDERVATYSVDPLEE